MQSRSARSKVFRAVGVLAALLLAAGVISPAFGAKTLKKGKVKKIAKKQATNQINALVPGLVPTVGNPLFIQETELDRFGPTTANQGEAEKTVHTFGPFTLSLRCDNVAGDINLRVQIATSVANSSVNTDTDDEADFDPDDVDVDIEDATNGPPGDPMTALDEDAEFFVTGPGGTPAYHGWVASASNVGTSHCWTAGWVLQLV